jgi:hypothetical protein
VRLHVKDIVPAYVANTVSLPPFFNFSFKLTHVFQTYYCDSVSLIRNDVHFFSYRLNVAKLLAQNTAQCSQFVPYVAKYLSDSKVFEIKVVNGRNARHGKLIFVKFVNKIPAFEPKLQFHVQNEPPLLHVLNKLNPVHILLPHFFGIHLTIILKSKPKSPPCLHPFGHVNHNSLHISNIRLHDRLISRPSIWSS